MSEDLRYDEEQATLRRARMLGLSYADSSQVANKTLYKGVLNNEEMYRLRIVPLQMDKSNLLFGITTTTSQQTIKSMTSRFQDQRVASALISDAGFREYMHLYDPPKKSSVSGYCYQHCRY